MDMHTKRHTCKTLIIIGCGGHGRAVADAADKMNCWNNLVFYDDNLIGTKITDRWNNIGSIDDLMRLDRPNGYEFIVGIGDNATRTTLTKKILTTGLTQAIVIHPNASISNSATIGLGSVIMAGAVINIGVSISENCIINSNSTVEHDCKLLNGSHISSGAQITGGVVLREHVWVGAGATVVNQASIGSNTIVGAGSTVLKDLPENVVAIGSPARVIKTRG